MIDTSGLRAVAHQKAYNAKRAFTSWQGFKDWVAVSDTALEEVCLPLPTNFLNAQAYDDVALWPPAWLRISMVEPGPGSHTVSQTNVGLVQLCDILLGSLLWQLDVRTQGHAQK